MLEVKLSHPPYDKRWLELLIVDDVFGLRFRTNHFYDGDHLGFSHQANKLGMKGPDDVNGHSVICGTSFGMGVGVDQGRNWYDIIGLNEGYLNISFPVSTRNHMARIDKLYRGNFSKLIFIYHPNIWFTSHSFELAAEANNDIFKFMGWDKRLKRNSSRFEWFLKKQLKKAAGASVDVHFDGNVYQLNRRYCHFECHSDFFDKEVDLLRELFSRFKETILVRVPIREEVAHHQDLICHEKGVAQFDQYWNSLKKRIEADRVFDFSRRFAVSDYHPKDNHWNENGNLRFASLMRDLF